VWQLQSGGHSYGRVVDGVPNCVRVSAQIDIKGDWCEWDRDPSGGL